MLRDHIVHHTFYAAFIKVFENDDFRLFRLTRCKFHYFQSGRETFSRSFSYRGRLSQQHCGLLQ